MYVLLPSTSFLKTGLSPSCVPCLMFVFVWVRCTDRGTETKSTFVRCLKCELEDNQVFQTVSFHQEFSVLLADIFLLHRIHLDKTEGHRWGCIHPFPFGSHRARLLERQSNLTWRGFLKWTRGEKEPFILLCLRILFVSKCLCVSLRLV